MRWRSPASALAAILCIALPGLGCGSPSAEEVEAAIRSSQGFAPDSVDCTKSGNLASGEATYYCDANDIDSGDPAQFCVAHYNDYDTGGKGEFGILWEEFRRVNCADSNDSPEGWNEVDRYEYDRCVTEQVLSKVDCGRLFLNE